MPSNAELAAMGDRELLLLAAKAAGMKPRDVGWAILVDGGPPGGFRPMFNPLENDEDAGYLDSKLDLWRGLDKQAIAEAGAACGDLRQAIRLAIVRAAAEKAKDPQE